MTDYCYDMLHGTCNNCIKWGVWKGGVIWQNKNLPQKCVCVKNKDGTVSKAPPYWTLVVPCSGCAENKNWTWPPGGRRCLGVSGISANENREQTVEEFAFTILHIIKPRFNMDIEEKRDEFYKYLNSVPDEVKSEYKKLCE